MAMTEIIKISAASSPMNNDLPNDLICPHDRIDLFVSSSMRDEEDFSWSLYRRELGKLLGQSPLFNPFEIEGHASIERPRNYYLGRVERSGIVVAVVRQELRQGTEEEIRHAINHGKPLVLILIGDKRDSATDKLISYIQDTGYCTYYEARATTVQGLARETFEQINNIVVDLVNKRVSQWQNERLTDVAERDSARYSLPKTSLLAFGDATALLAKNFGYEVNRKRQECPNPYLAALGSSIVAWLLKGERFSIEPFIPTIHIAMKDAGIASDVLDSRLKALDCFIDNDYDRALTLERQACELLPYQDSWLYGNCLIDIRNLSGWLTNGDWKAGFDAQKQIEELKAPALFPPAEHFSNSALSQTLITERKYRTQKQGSLIFDSTLSTVLNDYASYAFVAVLYGSIASFNYSRVLIAHTLLDYSETYLNDDLAYEGVKLLVLAGEASEFAAQFNNGAKGFSNSLKASADDLWVLSGKGIASRIPVMRCALVRQVVPYLSDGVFADVEEYLSSDLSLFSKCRTEWLRAINAIKLRMNGAVLADLIFEMLSSRLYALGSDVGRIIAGSNLDALPKSSLEGIAGYLKEHASDLIKDHMQLSAFSVVGRYLGEDLVGQTLTDSLGEIERNEYLRGLSQGEVSAESYVNELVRQFDKNDVSGYYACPAYSVAAAICDVMDKGATAEFAEYIREALDGIVGRISDYKGFAVALDESMAVLCRYVCMLRLDGKELPDNWLEQIRTIDGERYTIVNLGSLNNYDTRTWKVRVSSLRVAAGLEDGIDYLADGFALGSFSQRAAEAYLESLEWFISSLAIPDEHAPLVKKICENAAEIYDSGVRRKAVNCLAVYSKRWGLENVANALLTLTRDQDDSVVYRMLVLCKAGSFGDRGFESQTIKLLSNDANWFIRWHAAND